MSRIWSCVTFWIAGLALGADGWSAQAVAPVEALLPNTTVAFVSVSDLGRLEDHWNRTQFGQLVNDPSTERFKQDLQREFESRWTKVLQRLGLTLSDLRGVPGGEFAAARILAGPDKAAVAVVVDVTDHGQQAEAMLEKVNTNLKKQGAQRSLLTLPDSPRRIIFFDVPPPKETPKGPRRKVYYFWADDVLGAADDLEVLQGILSRVPGHPQDSLAAVPPFQSVMARCKKDLPEDAVPQIRWFVHPVGLAEATRVATPEQDRRKGKSVVELLKNQGFEAVRGMGGYVDFDAEGFDLIHRTFVYAPPPYKASMKIFVLPDKDDHAPPSWVPRDVATYTSLDFDILNAFDSFAPLFNELSGGLSYQFRTGVKPQAELEEGLVPQEFRKQFEEFRTPMRLAEQMKVTTKVPGSVWEIRGPVAVKGKSRQETFVVRKIASKEELRVYLVLSGIWEEFLEGIRIGQRSPKVDLREELIKHLGQRVTVLTDYQLPISSDSERLLYAIEATDPEKVLSAAEKIMQVEVRDGRARRHSLGDHIVWEMIAAEEAARPDQPGGRKLPPPDEFEDEFGEELDEEESGSELLLPRAAVTVAHGQLFIASHLDFLLKVLNTAEQADPSQTLGRSVDFRMVDAAIQQSAGPQRCVQAFSRTAKEYHVNYELLRQGKMPEAETMLGKLLNNLLSQGDELVRSPRIPGENMPPYDSVRRALAPAGAWVTSQKDGWFLKGFTLKKP